MSTLMVRIYILAVCLAAPVWPQGGPVATEGAASWSPKAAAAYLDSRMAWWITWPSAARDHETFCISCHTAAPYAMSRARLRAALGEQAPSANERKLLDNVIKRVRLW